METVEFRVMSKRYSVQIRPEYPYFDQNRMGHIIPAKIISFLDGKFVTSDPEIIEGLRQTPAYKQKKIVEITEADKHLFDKPSAQETVRGPISAGQLEKEAGKEPAAPAKHSVCEICGKEFADDPHGKRINLHKISHRRLKVEEK